MSKEDNCDESTKTDVKHFKKRAMGCGKRRLEGRCRGTAPKANTEAPQMKSLCKPTPKPMFRPVPKEELPPPSKTLDVADLYEYALDAAPPEIWKDILIRKRFLMHFNPAIEVLPCPERAYMACLRDLVSQNYQEVGSFHMFIGFEIYHNDLPKPICLPFVPIDDIPDDLLENQLLFLHKNTFSLRKLSTYDLEVVLVFAKQLTGSGINESDMIDGDSELMKKMQKIECGEKYCVVPNNVTKYCLGTAFLQGKLMVEHEQDKGNFLKEERWNAVQTVSDDTLDILKDAKDILEKANIMKEDNFTISDVEKLQNIFSGVFQIVVLADASNKAPVYKGPGMMNKNIIPLLLKDNHFRLIKRLANYMGAQHYCVHCNVRYMSSLSHHNCPLRCRLCVENGCTPETGYEKRCDGCGVTFFSEGCFARHKRPGLRGNMSMCQAMLYCPKCDRSYKRTVPHVCNISYCQHCQVRRPKGHMCTMSPKDGGGSTAVKGKLIIVNTKVGRVRLSCGTVIEKPVVIMALRICTVCMNEIPLDIEEGMKLTCSNCSTGNRLRIFERCTSSEADIMADFVAFLVQKWHERYVLVFREMPECLNKYLLSYFATDGNVSADHLSIMGTKLRSFWVKGIKLRFVDLSNFLPASRADLRAMIGLPKFTDKVFPKWFTCENFFENCGDVPDLDFYDESDVATGYWPQFSVIHAEWVREGKTFSFLDEILEVTYLELAELSAAVMILEKATNEAFGIRMVEEAEDIRRATLLAYIRSFFTDEILPLDIGLGAKFSQTYSATAMKYLAWRSKKEGIPIDSTINVGEYRVPGTPYHLDGFIQPCEKYPRGKGIDVKGCYYHAHQCPLASKILPRRELTVETITKKDKEREQIIRQHIELETVWECEIVCERMKDPEMDNFMKDVEFMGYTDSANAVFPLRNEVLIPYASSAVNGQIFAKDITSFMGEVLKFGDFPTSLITRKHGELIKVPIRTPDELTEQVKGIVYCKVTPPRKLWLPVLPYRTDDGRVVYPLCKACAESFKYASEKNCNHADSDRQLVGTWATCELELALQLGYVIDEVIGAQHWNEWKRYKLHPNGAMDHGLFSEYADRLMFLRETAAGPSERDVQRVWKELGVKLDKSVMPEKCTPIHEAVLQLMKLADLFSEKTDTPKTRLADQSEFWSALEDGTSQVKEVKIANHKQLAITVGKKPEYAMPTKETVLMIPALVYSQARVLLYKLLWKSRCELLYIDDRTVVYRSRTGDPLNAELPYLAQGVTNGSQIVKYASSSLGTVGIFERKQDGETVSHILGNGLDWPTRIQDVRFHALFESARLQIDNKPLCMAIKHIRLQRDCHEMLVQEDHEQIVCNFYRHRIFTGNRSIPFGW